MNIEGLYFGERACSILSKGEIFSEYFVVCSHHYKQVQVQLIEQVLGVMDVIMEEMQTQNACLL